MAMAGAGPGDGAAGAPGAAGAAGAGCNNVPDDVKSVADKGPFDMLPIFTCTLQIFVEVQQAVQKWAKNRKKCQL